MNLDEFITIHIQPIFNANTMGITYAEVLLRPKVGNIGVMEILNEIEACGRSVELDKFILNKSCEFIQRNERKSAVKITVNLSRMTLEKENVYKEILGIISKRKIRKSSIILELHECTNYNSIAVKGNIAGFIGNGVQLAMDDFGIGNANLENLNRANVKLVKFDKVFLSIKDVGQLYYIRNLIKSMHRLGIDTVIEGVETREQLHAVQQMGYGHIQGFLLAKPMSTQTYKTLYA